MHATTIPTPDNSDRFLHTPAQQLKLYLTHDLLTAYSRQWRGDKSCVQDDYCAAHSIAMVMVSPLHCRMSAIIQQWKKKNMLTTHPLPTCIFVLFLAVKAAQYVVMYRVS